MISIKAYCAFTGRSYNILRYLANSRNVVFIRCENVLTLLLFLLFSFSYLPILLHAVFALFILQQLLLDRDIDPNPVPKQNNCKSSGGRPKRIKAVKGTQKCVFNKNINVDVPSDAKVQNLFKIQSSQSAYTLLSHIQLLALALWSRWKNWNLR